MLEAGFDLDPRQLLLCETEVYGLISGPSWLRQSLVHDFEQMGYVRSKYDKCIMALPSTDPDSHINDGVVLLEVDDLLEAGNANHRSRMDQFYKNTNVGKQKDYGSWR